MRMQILAPGSLIAVATLALAGRASAQGFEGVVTFQTQQGTMAQTYKGAMVRNDMNLEETRR